MQSRGRSENTTKVFVGSLPTGVTPDNLRKLFEPYGAIAECDISNGCGFLHLEDKDLATKAITELNGTEFMGGRISVERGRVKPRRGNGPMRGRDRGGPYPRGGAREFRGPPRGPGGFGGRDRFNGPPNRGGFGGPPGRRFDERRPNNSVPVPYSGDRGYEGGYGAPAGNFTDRGGYGDGPRGGYDDRRGAPPPRASGGPDLFTRRDAGPKPMAGGGGYDNSRYGGNSNGYGPSAGYVAGPPPPSFNTGMQGGNYGASYGNNVAPTGAYGDSRDTYGAPVAPTGYNQAPTGYDTTNYGAVQGTRGGGYDVGYPPLPAQRGYGSGSGGPGPRGGAPGRRF